MMNWTIKEKHVLGKIEKLERYSQEMLETF